MRTALFVGIAGAIGAICRVVIGELLSGLTKFPLATLSVNLLGTLLLCLLSAGVIQRLTMKKELQTAITTGFLGSFTTFSAISIETVNLIQNGQHAIAMLYVLSSVIGGLAVGTLGLKLGQKWVKA